MWHNCDKYPTEVQFHQQTAGWQCSLVVRWGRADQHQIQFLWFSPQQGVNWCFTLQLTNVFLKKCDKYAAVASAAMNNPTVRLSQHFRWFMFKGWEKSWSVLWNSKKGKQSVLMCLQMQWQIPKSEDCGSLVDERASFCVVMVFCSIKWWSDSQSPDWRVHDGVKSTTDLHEM